LPGKWGAAHAEVFTFACITNNAPESCAIGELQLAVEITDPNTGDGLIDFTFTNAGPEPSVITGIYFDDHQADLLIRIETIDGSEGTAFTVGATPRNLPGGHMIDFRTSSAELRAGAMSPGAENGVDPGEFLTLTIELSLSGTSLADVLTALEAETLRIGVHVQAFDVGRSESYVNTDLCGSPEGPPGDASCEDGLDNDCDQFTDGDDPDCVFPPETACFGLTDCEDPDCEGATDGPCDTGEPGICADGTRTCAGGNEECVQDVPAGTEGPPGDASCEDGLDNDCDQFTDGDDPDCGLPASLWERFARARREVRRW
jgi:hypothetical protein